MGQRAACTVPGSHAQTKDPWNGRMPMVAAYQNADGTWELRGLNGAQLSPQSSTAYGVSILKLGKLNGPITSVDPVVSKTGDWSGKIIGLAEDGGTFAVSVTVKYL